MQLLPRAAPPAPPRGSVLLVDDIPDNVSLLGQILEHAGYRITVAHNGEEALAQLEVALPDLVLLDYMMPNMNGPEVLRRMRAAPRTLDVPVIMLTASTGREHIDAALAAGANDFVSKPFDRPLLLTRIESTIRAAQDRAELRHALRVHASHSALVRGLEEAAQVQRSRLPVMPFSLPNFTLTGALVPGHHVCGDAYDVMTSPDGTPIVALIDVCGHGLAAALVAASIVSQLRALCSSHALPDAMRFLNSQMSPDRANKFACIGVAELHNDHAFVINAGLPPITLIRDGACVRKMECAGTPPGLFDGADYVGEHCAMKKGDRLVFASDGLTEPFGRPDEVEPFLGGLGLLGMAKSAGALSSDNLHEGILKLIAAASDGEHDDATILIAERV